MAETREKVPEKILFDRYVARLAEFSPNIVMLYISTGSTDKFHSNTTPIPRAGRSIQSRMHDSTRVRLDVENMRTVQCFTVYKYSGILDGPN